jgi:hypothetical protein
LQGQDTLRRSLGVSYLSEGGVYPGIALNYEKVLLQDARYQLLFGGKAGGYVHFRNHTGVFFMVQSGQRFRLTRRLWFEDFLGIGYLHSFLSGGDAYYVNASGQLQRARNIGSPHFMPSVSAGLSYKTTLGGRPASILARPIFFWQIPFNKASLLQYAVEIGVLVKLKS